jgi:hypothetical protein
LPQVIVFLHQVADPSRHVQVLQLPAPSVEDHPAISEMQIQHLMLNLLLISINTSAVTYTWLKNISLFHTAEYI